MVKRMLVDTTHPEETRVVVLDGTRLDEFDVETSTKKQIKGNIYLAKVVRVEPSLQSAFVDYGGNRNGFLAFSEIHPDYYQIPVADRERLLAEVDSDSDEDEPHSTDTGSQLDDSEENRHSNDALESNDTEPQSSDELAASEQEYTQAIPLDYKPPAISGDVMENVESETESHPGDSAPDGDSAEPNHSSSAEAEVETTQLEITGDTAQDFAAGENSLSTNSVVDANAPPEMDSDADELTANQNEFLDDEPDESTSAPNRNRKDAGVETVGGDDEEETAGEDRKRRRFLTSRHYKIQEVIKRRQIMLIQVVKDERGTKCAAFTTFLSLAGRYCVLMPNSARGGGVSRKITSSQDRRRLKAILGDLKLPKSMAVILRTAGAERNKAEIKRDHEYLQRTWNGIRESTMTSRAPALIHEEANLIKRAIRDIYTRDIEEVWIDGEEGYKTGKDFMKMLTPSHAKKVQKYKDEIIPLFHRYQVETQLEAINNPFVQLKSGGSIVFAQTEALVAIDVNSGRSTKERHIEETAYRTNLEAVEEIARQLRLRDLAGLIVIDFIDMEENRNNHSVERKLKEALRVDRARIQVGRISHFGLLELSRQRLRPSLIETNFRVCNHCSGSGLVRSTESAAVHSLRVLEEEGVRQRSSEVTITVHPDVALYLVNYKRHALGSMESRYGIKILILGDNTLVPPDTRIDRVKKSRSAIEDVADLRAHQPLEQDSGEDSAPGPQPRDSAGDQTAAREDEEDGGERKRRRRRRKRHVSKPHSADRKTSTAANEDTADVAEQTVNSDAAGSETGSPVESDDASGNPEPHKPSSTPDDQVRRGRRRGRRGGRRRRGEPQHTSETINTGDQPSADSVADAAAIPAQDTPPQSTPSLRASQDNSVPAANEEAENARLTTDPATNESDTASRGPSRLFRTLWKRGENAKPDREVPVAQPTPPDRESPSQTNETPSVTPPRRGWWQGSGEP
jgi:ribonuclease E